VRQLINCQSIELASIIQILGVDIHIMVLIQFLFKNINSKLSQRFIFFLSIIFLSLFQVISVLECIPLIYGRHYFFLLLVNDF
jgi:hypothetical protein